MTIYDVIIYHIDYMKYKQLQNLMNIRDNYFLLCVMSIILLYGVSNLVWGWFVCQCMHVRLAQKVDFEKWVSLDLTKIYFQIKAGLYKWQKDSCIKDISRL